MGWFKKVRKAVKKAVHQTGKVVGNVGQTGIDVVKSTGSGLVGAVNQTGKAVDKAVNQTGKAVGKAVHQTGKVVGNVGKIGVDVVKSTGNGLVGAVTSAVKGDVIGAVTNWGKFMTAGQVDLTGKKEGLINVNAKKYIAKALGAGGGTGASISTSAAPTYTNVKKKKGLVTQLRQGKGVVGGGSYTTVAKNPLGGASGMTGK